MAASFLLGSPPLAGLAGLYSAFPLELSRVSKSEPHPHSLAPDTLPPTLHPSSCPRPGGSLTPSLPFSHELAPSSPALAGCPVPMRTSSPAGEPLASRLHNSIASELTAPEKIREGERGRKGVFAPTTLLTTTPNCPFKYMQKPLAASVLGGLVGGGGSRRRGKHPPLNCVQPQLWAGARCRRQLAVVPTPAHPQRPHCCPGLSWRRWD